MTIHLYNSVRNQPSSCPAPCIIYTGGSRERGYGTCRIYIAAGEHYAQQLSLPKTMMQNFESFDNRHDW